MNMLQQQPTTSHYQHKVSFVDVRVYIINHSIAEHFDGFVRHFTTVYAPSRTRIDTVNPDFFRLQAQPLSIKVEWDEPENGDDPLSLAVLQKESTVQRTYVIKKALETHFPAYIEPYFGIYFKSLYNRTNLKVLSRNATTAEKEYKVDYDGNPFALLKEATGQLSIFDYEGPVTRLKNWHGI